MDVTNPTSRAEAASHGHVANPPLPEAPAIEPSPPGSGRRLTDRQRDDLEDDAVRDLTADWVAERRIRQDRRFRVAGVTESELRAIWGNR